MFLNCFYNDNFNSIGEKNDYLYCQQVFLEFFSFFPGKEKMNYHVLPFLKCTTLAVQIFAKKSTQIYNQFCIDRLFNAWYIALLIRF